MLNRLDRFKEYGPIFIRLIIGFHLVYGTQDNLFSYARMEEFAAFLSAHNVDRRKQTRRTAGTVCPVHLRRFVYFWGCYPLCGPRHDHQFRSRYSDRASQRSLPGKVSGADDAGGSMLPVSTRSRRAVGGPAAGETREKRRVRRLRNPALSQHVHTV